MQGRAPDLRIGIIDGVDDSGVATAGNQYEALIGVDDEGLIFRQNVGASIILLGVLARHRSGEPDAREHFAGLIVFDKAAAGGLVISLDGGHLSVLAAEEDALTDVRPRES